MIYLALFFYLNCGLGVTVALIDSDDGRIMFLVYLVLWPMMLAFAVTAAAKRISEEGR